MDLEAQAPSRTFSQTSTLAQDNEKDNDNEHTAKSYLAVVVHGLDDGCTLHHVAVKEPASGEHIWCRIRQQVLTPTVLNIIWRRLMACYTKTIVGTATTQALHLDHEATMPAMHHHQVSIENFQQDWLLTKAFHQPHLLSQNTKDVNEIQRFTVNATHKIIESNRQDVLVIRTIIDKTKVAWLLIILLILSPGLGLIVGVCTHKAEVGIAVSAGVFALAAFLQGLAAWFHS